ncbi:MAG: ATP-binding protein [Dehalococcoidia bacterium]
MHRTLQNILSIVRLPLAAGLVAILLIACSILVAGDSLLRKNVLQQVREQQSDDLVRFSTVLHYSGLALAGTGGRETLPEVASTSEFDSAARRAMFGLDAIRIDLFTLEGTPVYSTDASLASLSETGQSALTQARRGSTTSVFVPSNASLASQGSDRDVVQTYALIHDAPPDVASPGRPMMVAAVSTDVSRELGSAYRTIWWVTGIFAVGLTLILVVLDWVSRRSRGRLERANAALAAQYEAVRESRERMIHSADATKRAIAEELHGTVQTKLYATWMRLAQFRDSLPPGMEQKAKELGVLVAELDSIREDDIRGLSHRLHPSIVRIGAAAGLRSLRNYYESLVPIHLNISDTALELEPTGASLIPEGVRLGVYRIAELALGNVLKHANASSCSVSWDYDASANSLALTIEDDGVGFNSDALERGGLGIVNISDYTDAMGGGASIDSEPGRGARIHVYIPFEPPTARTDRQVVEQSETVKVMPPRRNAQTEWEFRPC